MDGSVIASNGQLLSCRRSGVTNLNRLRRGWKPVLSGAQFASMGDQSSAPYSVLFECFQLEIPLFKLVGPLLFK